MLTKINHIGIAVKSLDESITFYRDNLGMLFAGIEVVEEQKVRVAMLQVGESKIELLEPTAEDSPVARFIEKNGVGIHHVAFEVEDVEAAIAKLSEEGVRMIDQKPRCGAHDTRIAFLHPKSSGGVLTELCQCGH
ncbi:MAG: methylmalonyl-CoA epimerase [Geobacteraceae bacterium GWC2_55_20]|nr:MAG: methylmalonyl-CoA epimerase [Geobacteraceae bacterium GWC2_55_20]OGU21891.1 MAG: methylmalonyl-CoA epimerase [Geobacteraceae bacterium GWF2_54_21]HBA71638.1 methylmalonyl-CoA epimerase [Geobacter sp.]HCE67078.1 methylmalonyl-CoA epimerase [Geobacter sp.]